MENKDVNPREVEQLTDMIQKMSSLLEKISSNHDKLYNNHGDHKAAIIVMQKELESAVTTISKIIKVLHEGNGQLPLVTRTALLEEGLAEVERDVGRLYDKIDSVHEKIDAINTRDNLRSSVEIENGKSKKEIAAAIISVVAAIASAVSAGM